MTDLTKITTPFGLLDEVHGPGTKAALKAHGGPYEYWDGGSWQDWIPIWRGYHTYRVKLQPLTKPSIDWSHVAPEYKWLARDGSGEGFLFTCKPRVVNSWRWSGCDGKLSRASAFASYTSGTCDWRDSLVGRPE